MAPIAITHSQCGLKVLKRQQVTLTPPQKWLLRLGMCSEKAPLDEEAIGVR
jgi:hypothetical protein